MFNLRKFDEVKQLPKGPTLTEEDAVRTLCDMAFRASKQMIRTHHKEDIISFIVLAKALEVHGYNVLWVKHKGVIGATRVQPAQLPKGVTRYANKGTA